MRAAIAIALLIIAPIGIALVVYTPTELVEKTDGAICDLSPLGISILECERRGWSAATSSNTAEGYRNFLGKYPQSLYGSFALERIDELEPRVARSSGLENAPSARVSGASEGVWVELMRFLGLQDSTDLYSRTLWNRNEEYFEHRILSETLIEKVGVQCTGDSVRVTEVEMGGPPWDWDVQCQVDDYDTLVRFHAVQNEPERVLISVRKSGRTFEHYVVVMPSEQWPLDSIEEGGRNAQ